MTTPLAQPPAPEKVVLTVNGQEFGGWKTVAIVASTESTVTNFSLTLSEKWVEGGQPAKVITSPVAAGGAVELTLDGEKVMTGFVESLDRSIEDGTHQVRIGGRSKTADISDCTVLETVNLRGTSVRQCIETLLKPFGIQLSISPSAQNASARSVKDFHVKSGETVLGEIKRLCTLHALLVSDGPWGDLILAAVGAHGDAITLDASHDAILGGSVSVDQQGLFSPVVIFGRSGAPTSDGGDAAALVQGRAVNGDVTRYRPMGSFSGGDERSGSATTQANSLVAQQKTRSVTANLRLAGWRRPDGKLWWKGQMVHLADAHLGYTGVLQIKRCELSLSESGSTVSLSLQPPEPLDPGASRDGLDDMQPD
ncbi:phage baseplate assembly protein [Lacibacterium aquatile]|uniref:Phage baseplate assembly protein n=1 Tax=Lacibacterium aquatile TaxID=1168082 RepID=A0ABW5DTW2_9PROT